MSKARAKSPARPSASSASSASSGPGQHSKPKRRPYIDDPYYFETHVGRMNGTKEALKEYLAKPKFKFTLSKADKECIIDFVLHAMNLHTTYEIECEEYAKTPEAQSINVAISSRLFRSKYVENKGIFTSMISEELLDIMGLDEKPFLGVYAKAETKSEIEDLEQLKGGFSPKGLGIEVSHMKPVALYLGQPGSGSELLVFDYLKQDNNCIFQHLFELLEINAGEYLAGIFNASKEANAATKGTKDSTWTKHQEAIQQICLYRLITLGGVLIDQVIADPECLKYIRDNCNEKW
jgi:hypothetical protein